jgi:SAM-dependent methyltransferase
MKEKIKNILLRNRFYDYGEYRLKGFIRRLSALTGAGKRILDVGAGELQYKKYFKHLNYVSQDLGVGDANWDYSKIDIISDIYNIPVEEKSFDYILCTQVIEHLKYPHQAFKEFSRILKSGGLLFVTCPLSWKEHQQPYDYFRYTQYALKMLAEENNFKVLELNKVGGKFITMAKLMNDLNISLRIKNKIILRLLMILFYPFNFILGLAAYFLDKLDKNKDLTLLYEGIFEKL